METQRNAQLMYNNTGATKLVTDYFTASQSPMPQKNTDDAAIAYSLKLRELMLNHTHPTL